MGILLFLILFGLVVILSPYILAGAADLVVYPALLGLVLLIIPPTRVLGIILLVACLFYYGIKESISDSKGRKLFIAAAKEAGYDRKAINKMLKTKKTSETWQECINQLGGTSPTAAQAKPKAPIVAQKHELTSEEANKYIKNDYKRAIALKFALERPNNINGYGLSNYARTQYKVDIPSSHGDTLLSSLTFMPKVITTKGHYDWDDSNKDYELSCTVSEDVKRLIDNKPQEIIRDNLKQQIEEYKQINVNHKDAIDKYAKTFISLAQKIIKKVDKWGDFDESKIDDLKLEFIYKIYKAINAEAYSSDKSKAHWADLTFQHATKDIGDARLVNGTPYWMKHFYDTDLPKLLTPYLPEQTEQQKIKAPATKV